MKLKKAKEIKECVLKWKSKVDGYKNYFEATQLWNKINQPKNKVDVSSLREIHKEFIKNY